MTKQIFDTYCKNQPTGKFYFYSQNNSGGSFTGPAEYVIIQADSAENADQKAIEIGLYFDGVQNGRDCSCCGDRWAKCNDYWGEDEGTTEPEIYGTKIAEHKFHKWGFDKTALIYYSNGRIEEYSERGSRMVQ